MNSSIRRTAMLAGVAAAAQTAPYLTSACAYATSAGIAPPFGVRRLLGIVDARSVALTFDDGPHAQGTPMVLDALDALGWKATFFVIGAEVVANQSLACEIVQRGHELGVHGWTHTTFLAKSPRMAYQELKTAKDAIAQAAGRQPRWFRPPFGTLSASALLAARRLNLETRLWSAWGQDWDESATAQGIVTSVMRGRMVGGTVLMHDGASPQSTGNWKETVAALPLLASRFTESGLEVNTLTAHSAQSRGLRLVRGDLALSGGVNVRRQRRFQRTN